MQRLEVSGAVRPIHGSLGVKRLRNFIQGLEILMFRNRREQVDQPAIIRFSGRTLLQEVV